MIQRSLDWIITIPWVLLILFWLTGGDLAHPEPARLNYYGTLILLFGLLRWRMTGDFLPEPVNRVVSRLARHIETCPRFWLAGVCCIYFTLLVLIHSLDLQSFKANAYDHTFVDQAIWNTAHGNGFLTSSISRNETYLGEHFAPILALLAPIYWIFDSHLPLFMVQTGLVVGGGLLLYLISGAWSRSPSLRLLLVTAYFLYEPLWRANVFDFREDTFFVPIFFGMIWALQKQKWIPFALLSCLSLFVKENAAIALVGFAVWLMAERRFRAAAVLGTASLLALYVINSLITPAFSGGGQTSVLLSQRMPVLSGGFGAFFGKLFENPLDLLTLLFAPILKKSAFTYMLKILLPIALFVSFTRPGFMPFLIALGLVFMNAFINQLHNIGFHYEFITVPFLFTALAYGFLVRAAAWGTKNAGGLLIALAFLLYGHPPAHTIRTSLPSQKHLCLATLLDAIPSNVSIATQTALLPHLDHREHAFILAMKDWNRDYLIASPIRGLSSYGTPKDWPEQVDALKSYRVELDSPVLKAWCRLDACGSVPWNEAIRSEECSEKGPDQ